MNETNDAITSNATLEGFELPLMPLREVVMSPHSIMPLLVGREASIKAIESAVNDYGKRICLVTQREPELEKPDPADLYAVGVVGRVLQYMRLPEGPIKVLFEGLYRISWRPLTPEDQENPFGTDAFPKVVVTPLPIMRNDGPETEALVRATKEILAEYAHTNKKLTPEILSAVSALRDPGQLADTILPLLKIEYPKKQEALELADPWDIAIMSRELITKYPKILEYSSIWMENITHVTRQGTKEFGLTNTNKLIRSYEGCVGLKTGSTSIAKYCLSAVAKRNDITLIAVVMAAPDYKVRFKDAASMLNYGFSKCSLYIDKKMEALPEIPVRNGKKKTVSLVYEEQFHYLDTTGQNIGNVKRKLRIHREVKAPVKKNTLAGEMIYSVDGKELGRVRILYGENAGKATYPDCLKKVFMRL